MKRFLVISPNVLRHAESQFKDAGPDTGSSRERTPATSSTFTGRAITIPWEKMKSNPNGWNGWHRWFRDRAS